ncbi:MAG: DUF1592 domain-containing protein [Fuerstiella sp.]|nr:DUF1592 domain-containing protein [Fuerstiella sp.]
MKIAYTFFVLILSAGVSSSADDSSSLQSTFSTHCIKCHGKDGKVEGEVNLLKLKSTDQLSGQPELLEKLVTVLIDLQMPPDDEPPLPAGKRKKMVTTLQTILQQALKTQAFGATPIRRMNRFQYNNAVVDLLELDRDIFQLNERLLRRRNDYFHPETGKMPDTVRISSRPLSKDIDNQRPEGFRGVSAFPQDKRAEHGFDNRADHLTLSPLLMESFLQLSQTIAESPDLNAKECRSWGRLFAPPGQAARGPIEGRYEVEQMRVVKSVGTPAGEAEPQNLLHYGNQWSGDTHLVWRCPKQDLELTVEFNVVQTGTGLHFRFTNAPDYGIFDVYLDDMKIIKAADLYGSKVDISDRSVTGLNIATGVHTLRVKCVGRRQQSPRVYFGLDFVEVTGRKSNAKPDVEAIAETDSVRSRLDHLLRHAFRRPVDAETLDRFTKFANDQIASGDSYEDTMRTVVGAVIGMPDFLYFYESNDHDGGDDELPGRRRLNDFDLASRLAQFFWSSIPDDTLLDHAEAGTLSDPDVLSAQIDRMLNDRRSSRFCDNFPAQWLQLERLITSIPDPGKFPYFYYHGYRTSMHMMSEPLLLFETVFVEDRSVIELLDPKFTWQSDMLRQNYDGKSESGHDVQVQVFKRVSLDDPRRGGVIANAAVMTMTAAPSRTQPITRGAWVNAVIFNDPPEPPPADVPPLPEGDAKELAKLTIRERLAAHRERADCAGCHDKIDPFGFALENFGPTGVWRDKYENGRDVDPGGVLFNQHEFKSFVEFKRLVVQEKKRFIRGFTAHLLSYALGRELGPADSPALDVMTNQAMTGKDQLRAVLKSVAMSEPFLHKNPGNAAKSDGE